MSSGDREKETLMARILIAEDDPNTMKLLNWRLQSMGHQTISAIDGGKALEMATKEKPDLILLDIMMPVMSGVQVLRKLKSQDETKNISVIMLTAKTQEEDIVGALEAGALDYVTKPFSFAELSARVNRVLTSRPQG